MAVARSITLRHRFLPRFPGARASRRVGAREVVAGPSRPCFSGHAGGPVARGGPADTPATGPAALRSPGHTLPEITPDPKRTTDAIARTHADRPLPNRRHDAATHRRPRALQRRGVVAPVAPAASTALRAVEEFEVGVQAPAGFFDPLNYCEDQPESFARRRAVERKHGRISMMAFVGILVHNADIEFPGYISKSQGVKFSDIPDGIYGFSKIPAAGILQIFLLTGLIELAWWPASNYSGDYGIGFWGKRRQGEDKLQKLNAEMANGRLAMLGVAGNMPAEGQTGMTFKERARAQLQPVRLGVCCSGSLCEH